MHVVMNMLACHSGSCSLRVGGFVRLAAGLELSNLSLHLGFCLRRILVMNLAVLCRHGLMSVLLWQTLLVLQRLYGGMVVMLVD